MTLWKLLSQNIIRINTGIAKRCHSQQHHTLYVPLLVEKTAFEMYFVHAWRAVWIQSKPNRSIQTKCCTKYYEKITRKLMLLGQGEGETRADREQPYKNRNVPQSPGYGGGALDGDGGAAPLLPAAMSTENFISVWPVKLPAKQNCHPQAPLPARGDLHAVNILSHNKICLNKPIQEYSYFLLTHLRILRSNRQWLRGIQSCKKDVPDINILDRGTHWYIVI